MGKAEEAEAHPSQKSPAWDFHFAIYCDSFFPPPSVNVLTPALPHFPLSSQFVIYSLIPPRFLSERPIFRFFLLSHPFCLHRQKQAIQLLFYSTKCGNHMGVYICDMLRLCPCKSLIRRALSVETNVMTSVSSTHALITFRMTVWRMGAKES